MIYPQLPLPGQENVTDLTQLFNLGAKEILYSFLAFALPLLSGSFYAASRFFCLANMSLIMMISEFDNDSLC